MRRTIPVAATAVALTIAAGTAIAAATPWTTDGTSKATPDTAAPDSPIGAMSGSPASQTALGAMMHGAHRGAHGGDHHAHGGHDVDSELGFLTHMIPHHEEAVVAAEQLRAGTEREEMRRFADEIIEVQTAEIEQMRVWLEAWYPAAEHTVGYEPMMRDLAGLEPDELDRAFLEDMIPHHMGAVMMAGQLLGQDLVVNAEVAPFARQIADDQRAEIMQMHRWLADWYDAHPMAGMHADRGMPGYGSMHGSQGMHLGGDMPGDGAMHGRGGMHGSGWMHGWG